MDDETRGTTPLDAMRRLWWVIALFTLIGAGAGVAYGLSRTPVYTAEARATVGRIDVSTQTIPGFAFAARALAETYSRAIVSRQIVIPVSEATGTRPEDVDDHLTATPIPESGVISVLGEDDTDEAAVRYANVGVRSLIEYVQHLNKFNPQSRELLEKYKKAAQALAEARAARPPGQPVPPSVSADIAEARVRLRSAEALYGVSQAGQAAPNTLQLLAVATGADDDRSSFTQRAAFAGAVGGLLLGVALALLLQGRRPRSD